MTEDREAEEVLAALESDGEFMSLVRRALERDGGKMTSRLMAEIVGQAWGER